MQQDVRRWVVLLTAIAMACLVTPSFAARRGTDGAPAADVAKTNIAEHVISWEPLVAYESISLRVNGKAGLAYQADFAPGAPVLFDLFDQNGLPLPDGTYSYELQLTPKISPQARGLLERARLNGNEPDVESRLRAVGALPKGPTGLSGFFTIKDGALVDPDIPELSSDGAAGTDYRLGAVAPQDIVHNDDVIITFSLCVGTDCANGESFGFDTIRLKENNLRIRAFDTSNSASFPSNDWQITFNDSTNGGANKFSIDDLDSGRTPFTIEAGASANALYVDDGGRVGLKTSTPVVELHIVDGDSPTLRLEQNGSSGFQAQTWDVVGNETNFFVRDVTNGSRLPFRIIPGAPSNSLHIAADGRVTLNSSSPNNNSSLTIVRSDNPRIDFVDTGSAPDWFLGSQQLTATTTLFRISAASTGGNELQIQSNGDVNFNAGATTNMTLLGASGNVTFRGSVSAASKPFKIDHPLDPANKFLYHTAVESPDMTDLYNGNVALDSQGEAWVELPNWFQSLNRDFRYQLTPIGAPGPNLYVASEIDGNRFQIAGGQPGMRVSWQVTGIRHDAWAEANRTPVEETKPMAERGTYLHPELYENQIKKAEVESPATAKPAQSGNN